MGKTASSPASKCICKSTETPAAGCDREGETDRPEGRYHPLNVGDLVDMRNRVVGRSKIQDRWRPELHVVTARPYPGIHVYAVKPFAGGQEQIVSGDDLLHARTPLEVAKDVPLPALDAPMPT